MASPPSFPTKNEHGPRFSPSIRASTAINLLRDGIPNDIVDRVAEVEPFQLAKTQDRRVLGSMTDLAHHYRYYIKSEGGLTHADIREVNRRMNRIPMSMLGMDYSIDAVRKQLTA